MKVRDVWCAKDQGKAWDDWMLRGQKPATAKCDVPEDKLLALGQQLMVRGTPTLFFADGSRISGALPLDQLKARLN
ncbi:putative thiol:disulfide interchange protein DsbC precursor [compost metagenome]